MIKYNINTIYDEIQKCLKYKLYFAALSLSLTLPDVCAKVQTKHEKLTKKLSYIDWFNKWYDLRFFSNLSMVNAINSSWGMIVYQLRCSVLHSNNIDVCEKQDRFYDLNEFDFFVEDTTDVKLSMKLHSYYDTTGTEPKKEEIKLELNLIHFINGITNAVRNFMLSDKYYADEFPVLYIKEIHDIEQNS